MTITTGYWNNDLYISFYQTNPFFYHMHQPHFFYLLLENFSTYAILCASVEIRDYHTVSRNKSSPADDNRRHNSSFIPWRYQQLRIILFYLFLFSQRSDFRFQTLNLEYTESLADIYQLFKRRVLRYHSQRLIL